jgi:hypothetical protein
LIPAASANSTPSPHFREPNAHQSPIHQADARERWIEDGGAVLVQADLAQVGAKKGVPARDIFFASPRPMSTFDLGEQPAQATSVPDLQNSSPKLGN